MLTKDLTLKEIEFLIYLRDFGESRFEFDKSIHNSLCAKGLILIHYGSYFDMIKLTEAGESYAKDL